MVSPPLHQVMHPRLPQLEQVAGYLARMDGGSQYTHAGPLVVEVESRHAQRLHVDPRQVVALSSGTSALTASVATSGRDAWIVPAFTFAATAHAVVNAGATLVLHDVDLDTWQLPTLGSAVVQVLPFGAPLPDGDCAGMIIDAAASLGQDDLDLSGLADDAVVMFSLNATKVMGCGEGGLAVCGSVSRAEEIRRWSRFAFDEFRIARGPGANASMPEMVAAYALAALDQWAAEREEWLAVRRLVTEASHGWPGLPHDQPIHPYWVIRTHDADHTEAVESALAEHNIASRRWWGCGLHRMPAFAMNQATGFPVTEALADTVLGLPMWRGMTRDHVDAIAAVLASTRHGADLG